MQEGKSDFKILTGKDTGKILLGRPKRRWKKKTLEIILKNRCQ
jgi:hypothetical protein